MGYGANACYCDIIDEELIKKLCPHDFQILINRLKRYDIDIETLAREIFAGDDQGAYILEGVDHDVVKENDEEIVKRIYQAYERLRKAFKVETEGLVINLNFHDQENDGDRYDDVNGYFWEVGGVYKLTLAGERYKDNIKAASWVIFG